MTTAWSLPQASAIRAASGGADLQPDAPAEIGDHPRGFVALGDIGGEGERGGGALGQLHQRRKTWCSAPAIGATGVSTASAASKRFDSLGDVVARRLDPDQPPLAEQAQRGRFVDERAGLDFTAAAATVSLAAPSAWSSRAARARDCASSGPRNR